MNKVFGENILKKYGLKDWKLAWIKSGGGLCIWDLKEIWIDEKYKHNPAMILHEIAHALTPDSPRGTTLHSYEWACEYTRLVKEEFDSLLRGELVNE